jgi:ankyrin repeat protein
MTPEGPDEVFQIGEKLFDEMLQRPRECQSLEMELKSAIVCKDVARCRELLQTKRKWLSEFKSHEHAELLGAAIHSGDTATELVGLLLQADVPAQCVYDYIGPDYQHTPVVTAAKLGRLDLIQKLVAAGADLFWKSPTGANALSAIQPSRAMQAPMTDTPDIAQVREWLMQQGMQIDPQCADSCRKLSWASAQPASWPDVPELLKLGIPFSATGWTPIMLKIASGTGDVSSLANLTLEDLNHRDVWSRTPFLLAVEGGNLAMAQVLLERDLHAKGHCGATALHIAAKRNHCHLIEWLLEKGLPLDTKDEFLGSALHAAVGTNSVDSARLLLAKGADVHERDDNNYGLIHDVPLADDRAMLELLLSAGANVNDVSGGGTWPLQDASREGNADAVAYLLQVGANPNLTSTGETALFAAVSSDSFECVSLLLKSGADVNATDFDGWTCLFHLRSEQVAQYLLEHGADPSISDQCDGLPEDWESIPISIREMLRENRKRRGV